MRWLGRYRALVLLVALVGYARPDAAAETSVEGSGSTGYSSGCSSEIAGEGPELFVPEPVRIAREIAHEAAVLEIVQNRLFPHALRVAVIARGGESLVLQVLPPSGPEFVVRAPRSQKFDRIASRYESEATWLRTVPLFDSEGARHLARAPEFRCEPLSGLPVLVMEQAPLGNLESHLYRFGPQRAVTDPKAFLRLWRQMALGIRAVHRLELVHRDVKPRNYLWFGTLDAPDLRLSDLGFAAMVGQQVSGLEGLLSGTLSHMSVNQLRRGHATPSDDLYALRISFFETLVGRPVWLIDAAKPENHVVLRNVDNFGTYPILEALPDPVAAVVPKPLQDVANGTVGTIDGVLHRIDAAFADFP